MDVDILNNTFSTGGEYELECAIELYGHQLLRYCHNILCDYHEAQDAVQTTFIKAYNKRISFKSGNSLSAWLYRIAYTTCIDILRKRKLLFLIPETKDIQSNTSTNFIDEDLKEALLKLTGPERALIFSRIIDGKSYKELEEIYQVPANTLRKRYERAKNKLIKAFELENSYERRLEGQK